MPHTIIDAAGRPSKLRNLATFYPAAVSAGDAQPVRIGSGAERAGVDIRIQRAATLSVRGRVIGVAPEQTKYSLSATGEDAFEKKSSFTRRNKRQSI